MKYIFNHQIFVNLLTTFKTSLVLSLFVVCECKYIDYILITNFFNVKRY